MNSILAALMTPNPMPWSSSFNEGATCGPSSPHWYRGRSSPQEVTAQSGQYPHPNSQYTTDHKPDKKLISAIENA